MADPFSDVPVPGVLDDAALLALLRMAFAAIAERVVMRRAAPTRALAADAHITT